VGDIEQRPVRSVDPEETAFLLDAARTVVIVPGYGMAAAQAQHKVRDLSDVLLRRGTDVKFAIHPVAGRMPGHMNVLLAEANVPYDQLYDLDAINSELPQTDLVLVVGANDVVNPAARTDTGSPIYGMPILDVDTAGSIIVVKRSMRSGFAGVDNELFYLDKTQMLFGDAKQVIGSVTDELSKLPAKEVLVA
jgi:NAD(P) transhydrogenase subunit beta